MEMYLRRQLSLKIASIFPGTLFPDAHPLKHEIFVLSWWIPIRHVYLMLLLLQCLTLCDPMDSSLPGSSVHGISQPRILEWVAVSFFRISSWPKDRIHISFLAGKFFNTEPPGKPHVHLIFCFNKWCIFSVKGDSGESEKEKMRR